MNCAESPPKRVIRAAPIVNPKPVLFGRGHLLGTDRSAQGGKRVTPKGAKRQNEGQGGSEIGEKQSLEESGRAAMEAEGSPNSRFADRRGRLSRTLAFERRTTMVPLAGIEPALLAELDFEFGADVSGDFLHVSCCIRKPLLSIMYSIAPCFLAWS